MSTGTKAIVVLTALSVEYLAVTGQLTNLKREDHPTGMIFERGELPGTSWEIYVAEAGEGNQAAAVLTERAIAWLNPRAVFFTGIAGGRKRDVVLGDVVVATQVWGYQGGKQGVDGFKGRPRTWETSFELQQAARYAGRGGWVECTSPMADTPPRMHFKPILAGEIVLDSPQSTFEGYLDSHYNGAAAIEMEGAGFASAAHLAGTVPFLVVRGISDKADGTKQATDATGTQETAARHAAAATMAVIAALPEPVALQDADAKSKPGHARKDGHDTGTADVPLASADSQKQINRAERGGVVYAVQNGSQTINSGPEAGDQ
ncbi:5'-methylthioadenosine/S-adenosylhomocysteine nucleosidase [Streptomyces rhizosphaerihabitans]|uniref:5'-methylthioadenosine/S-adenosylhomocysteine nucleosidase n=1 Tax=Streptomyces rhizosphaerihabitans TaxID=1266770 RepID=UPI0021BF56C5|nr:5'-methylthioadenosine/S-adenosylhomocysteine nucleosidase [Streptomyces rhizosphaerihabitans]MCT9011624.1 5'-methylthioadenosine/S-adenosylhomocysteine nucleosidase [Streptomyces rhizosphaerihabitans]